MSLCSSFVSAGVFAPEQPLRESQNHRGWQRPLRSQRHGTLGWEGAFGGHPAHPLCSEWGHLQGDPAAPSPVRPGLERSQGQGISQLSGQPGPGFHHPHGEKCLPYAQPKSALPEFKAVTPCPVLRSPSPAVTPHPHACSTTSRRATSPRCLNPPRDGDSPPALGSLAPRLTALPGQKLFPISSLSLP